MSLPLNNDFNSNLNSSSDNQDVNNSEVESQQPHDGDNNTENNTANSPNEEGSPTELPEDPQKDQEDKVQKDADANVNLNASENNQEGAVFKDNKSDNFGNSGTESTHQLGSDISQEKKSDFNLSEKEIREKTAAVKDFAFCKLEDDKIPVYPYVVALTGHRDAIITKDIREMAKRQLRSLAKAWNSSMLDIWRSLLNHVAFTRKCLHNKTAPLIALVGIADGKSGDMWTEIAKELRDEENFNIKIVAVAHMPIQYLISGSVFSPSADRNVIDLKQVDGLIELPLEEDVEYLLKDYKFLETLCTDDKPNTQELYKMLLSKKSIYEKQFAEYQKFMCVHSHALITLDHNADKLAQIWNDKNEELDIFTSLNSEKNNPEKFASIQHELTIHRNEIKAACQLEDLIDRIYKLRQRGADAANFQELKNHFEELADELHEQKEESDDNFYEQIEEFDDELDEQKEDDVKKPRIHLSRTKAIISYKLFGNLKARINPFNTSNGINVTSIGPVVCIHAETENSIKKLKLTDAADNKPVDVTIIVKDQPDDNEYDLSKTIPWNPSRSFLRKNKPIAKFSDINDVFSKLGLVNYKCIKNYRKYINDKNVSYSKNDAAVFKSLIDQDTDALFKHSRYASYLKSYFYFWMKLWTFFYAILALILLSAISFSFSFLNNSSENGHSSIIPYVFISVLLLFQLCFSRFTYHKLYHYFQALTDGLNIQLFWKLSGINEDVPGKYFLHQINDIAWLRAAFNGLGVTLPFESNLPFESENSKDDKDSTKEYIENNKKQLNRCIFIKNWINSLLDDLTGKNRNSLDKYKNTMENSLDLFLHNLRKKAWYDNAKNHLAFWLNKLSPFGGKLALAFYAISPFLYFMQFDCKSLSTNNSLPAFVNSAIYGLLIFLLFVYTVSTSTVVVYNAYRKAALKDLDIKRRKQLLYPYRRVSLLLKIKLAHWKNALQEFEQRYLKNKDLQQNQDDDSDNSIDQYSIKCIVEKSYGEFKKILEDIGKIQLAISAEWLLGVNRRQLELPTYYFPKSEPQKRTPKS